MVAKAKKKTSISLLLKKAEQYIGVKVIKAIKLPLGEYNSLRGWTLPKDENPKTKGYLVQYPDGYISWCPEKQFEEANTKTDSMNFGLAIEAMKLGMKVARAGWNGKGMWCIYVPGTKKANLHPGTPYALALPKRKSIEILPHFDMYTINAKGRRAMLPGWLASQSDMDAIDWCVVK